MCIKKNYKSCNNRIDQCMQIGIRQLLYMTKRSHIKIVGCCCGHNKYNMTIILKNISTQTHFELFSGVLIPRTRRFYKRDREGYYYIPELKNK